MDVDQLSFLCKKDADKIPLILGQFNKENESLFKFEKFHGDSWLNLWKAVFLILNDEALEKCHILCLNTVRILSRDEDSLNQSKIVKDVNCLLKMAHLAMGVVDTPQTGQAYAAASTPDSPNFNTDRVIESLKCLCNLVFQSVEIRSYCVRHNVADCIIQRLSSSIMVPSTIELFDMKLLFLITALEPSVASRVLIELNGLTYMTESLDEKLRNSDKSPYTNEQIEVLCEMLKVMFNITSCTDKSPSDNEIQSLHLTGVIRDLLFRFGSMQNDMERNVVSHSINLLTNISSSCLSELMQKCDTGERPTSSNLGAGNTAGSALVNCKIFENRNVRALDILLSYLRYVLEEQEKNTTNGQKELVQPVLTILVKCVCSNSIMRHYIRSVILPPLRDVYKRPEEGKELRNYLCRLLTSANLVERNLAYELLLVCCKKSASRLIKHFGYGNMAGLFANAGLLANRKVDTTEFSSDSEDSDTEEYKNKKDEINPVLGCYSAPMPNPLEGMSEEQKEYEALKLVNLVDKLHRNGIIQPCRFNEEGKPEPVDHILELQTELPQQQMQQKSKD